MSGKAETLVRHYESCFKKFGDSAKGVDWPNAGGARNRYRVMSELMPASHAKPATLLDYGCGLAHFYQYLKDERRLQNLAYAGVDASPIFVEACQKKYPKVAFATADVLKPPFRPPRKTYDYIVLNGVMTEKRELSQKKMVAVFEQIVAGLFPFCKKGMAFNVMSKRVDWERDDLFHLGFDQMSEIVAQRLSRHFVVRHDYGLYEYTVYVYRKPN